MEALAGCQNMEKSFIGMWPERIKSDTKSIWNRFDNVSLHVSIFPTTGITHPWRVDDVGKARGRIHGRAHIGDGGGGGVALRKGHRGFCRMAIRHLRNSVRDDNTHTTSVQRATAGACQLELCHCGNDSFQEKNLTLPLRCDKLIAYVGVHFVVVVVEFP
jgi:hypothetical protein